MRVEKLEEQVRKLEHELKKLRMTQNHNNVVHRSLARRLNNIEGFHTYTDEQGESTDHLFKDF